jgi:ankyrin repeat protein
VEVIRDLLAYGANINARDDYGDNALIIAAELARVEVLKELISAGARIDAANSVGQTALFGAARNSVEAVNLLLTSGADVNARDEDGQTACWLWLRMQRSKYFKRWWTKA